MTCDVCGKELDENYFEVSLTVREVTCTAHTCWTQVCGREAFKIVECERFILEYDNLQLKRSRGVA
jgi:hypothetical protein